MRQIGSKDESVIWLAILPARNCSKSEPIMLSSAENDAYCFKCSHNVHSTLLADVHLLYGNEAQKKSRYFERKPSKKGVFGLI